MTREYDNIDAELFSAMEYISMIELRIAELEAENIRITDAYKELITKLNAEDRADINISP